MVVERRLEVKNPAEVPRNQDGTFKVTRLVRASVRSATQKMRRFSKSLIMTDSTDRATNPPARRWQIEKIA
jgi:hypothetical protein